jgi:hypothetical protein
MGDRIGVLVTTLHKGVFFGFIFPEHIENKAVLRMQRARNCIYWAASVGGFLGLASRGPDRDCRVGKEAPEIILHDITSVAICTQEAIDAWTST